MIYAPAFRDKIVQIALNNVLVNVLVPILVKDTYASIKGRGTHKAAFQIQHNLRCAERNYGDGAYTLKLDIKKFFYNINRDILKNIFRKYVYGSRIINLIDTITDSAKIMGPVEIPLGNTVSQLSANLYLNELDWYIKRTFGIKYYVRYMDDVILQCRNKNEAKTILNKVEHYLNEILKLELNKQKSVYYPINHCVNSVGYKIWATHMKLRDSSKKSLKRILNEKDCKVMTQRFNSWKGHAEKACSYNFIVKNTLKYLDEQELVQSIS